MGCPGQVYWGGLLWYFFLQGIFLTQGLNPSPALQVESLPFEPPGKALMVKYAGVYKGVHKTWFFSQSTSQLVVMPEMYLYNCIKWKSRRAIRKPIKSYGNLEKKVLPARRVFTEKVEFELSPEK